MSVIKAKTPVVHGPDLNKTEITLRVTEAASNWLLSIGAKAVETEVPVAKSWVADLAAFWTPTMTEAAKMKIIPLWATGNRRGCSWKESITAYKKLPSIITIVHEVKTSIGDFKRDKKFCDFGFQTHVADMRVISMTEDVYAYTRKDHLLLPIGWWILIHRSDGVLQRVAQRFPVDSEVIRVDDSKRLQVVASIAERRHNRTANAYIKEVMKSYAKEERNRKVVSRVSKCMRAVQGIMRGEYDSVEECLQVYFSTELPKHLIAELRDLHKVELELSSLRNLRASILDLSEGGPEQELIRSWTKGTL